jgi:hypothetical protein
MYAKMGLSVNLVITITDTQSLARASQELAEFKIPDQWQCYTYFKPEMEFFETYLQKYECSADGQNIYVSLIEEEEEEEENEFIRFVRFLKELQEKTCLHFHFAYSY